MKPAWKRLNKPIRIALAALLILVGIYVIASPMFDAWRFETSLQEAMDAWLNNSGGGVPDNLRINDLRHNTDAFAGDDLFEETVNPQFDVDYLLNNMDGIITIPQIGIRSPVLRGADKRKLDISICSVLNSSEMGKPGNCILAGHNSRVYGRHFNRLNELAVGDTVTVENRSGEYNYRVSKIFSVSPSDAWVLDDIGKKKILTLITCDYNTKPVGRLIVRCEIDNGQLS